MINLVWAYYPFDVCGSVVISPVSFLISVTCVFFFFASLATGLTISLIFSKNQLYQFSLLFSFSSISALLFIIAFLLFALCLLFYVLETSCFFHLFQECL